MGGAVLSEIHPRHTGGYYMSKKMRMISAALAGTLLLSMLTGCSSDNTATPSATQTSVPTAMPTVVPEDAAAISANVDQDVVVTAPEVTEGLDATQRNSISMLNHLAVLTQEINASQNSRMYLEEAYSMLINNTFPNAVDSRTLSQLTGILDILEKYRMIAVKRERLDYVYEQNRAQAIRSAVPSPLGLMSAVQSFSLSKLAASVVYMAVDSYTSYASQTAQADMQYLQDGWTLDDEAAAALHESRKSTFSYMVRIVGDYGLPGDLTLSENAVDEFVKWENNDNVTQRIQFLEANVDTYQALGTYWIVLAESYYENVGFGKADHVRLRDTLAGSRSKFLVSYNDCEEIRSLYDGYNMYSYERLNNIRQRFDGGSMFGELLISNYDMEERIRTIPEQLIFDEYERTLIP